MWVIESLQELHTGAFPTPTAAHKGQCLPRFHRHRQPPQHLDVWPAWVREFAVHKLYLAFEIILPSVESYTYIYTCAFSRRFYPKSHAKRGSTCVEHN